MKFLIRDDDLNYFSTPTDIERWYADIFALEIPVGFAAIPFVKPTSDVYPFFPREARTPDVEKKEYLIQENAELVTYIKKNPLIEILQHGCTHETLDGVYEYRKKVGLIEDSIRGKEQLERAFGQRITVFAAPHDWIDTSGIRGIEAAQLNVIRGRGVGLRNWIPRWQYLVIFLKMVFYRFPHYISTAPSVYPYVLNFGRHKEMCSYRLEDPDVFDGLQYVKEKDGVFVVVVHVHTLTSEKKELLMRLIAKAKEYDAEFVAPRTIFL
jgi:peptidoglycan/xylan/chitin deacetylase (PgdA/CDA1 family)